MITENKKYIENFNTKYIQNIFPGQSLMDLNKMFNCSYQVLVTYNPKSTIERDIFREVNSIIADSMRMQWLHMSDITIDIDKFNSMVNYCYMSIVTMPQETVRPIFSIFTTCYKSYDKIS